MIRVAFLLASIGLGAHPAVAAPLSGRFTGVMDFGQAGAMSASPVNLTGDALTGTFFIDTSVCIAGRPFESPSCIIDPKNFKLSFSVTGAQHAYTDDYPTPYTDASVVSVSNDGAKLIAYGDVYSPYETAYLSLQGSAAQPFVQGTDFGTLAASPVSAGRFEFMLGRSFYGQAHLTEITFDPVAIPEPATPALVLLAVAGLALLRGRAARRV